MSTRSKWLGFWRLTPMAVLLLLAVPAIQTVWFGSTLSDIMRYWPGLAVIVTLLVLAITKPWRKSERITRSGIEEVLPPEGVPLYFKIAGPGVRLAAQIADILITVVAAAAFVLCLLAFNLTGPQTLGAVASLLFFIIRIPYYVVTELLWNGQTLGKRFLSIKVIAADGGSLSARALVMRNLMKEAEIFLPGTLLFAVDQTDPVAATIAAIWIMTTLAVPLLNQRRQRMGDLLAGTFVIHLPEPILLKDLAMEPEAKRAEQKEKFTFLAHQLDHYGAYELQTLEDLLRAGDRRMNAADKTRRSATLEAIVGKIRVKIDYADPVEATEVEAFLAAFYKAQRAYLEQRQIFGEKRADKRHGADKDESNEA